MLIVVGGLPGVGKTTIAKALAAKIPAVYLRIDAIEQALRSQSPHGQEMGPQGYLVGQAIAGSNLQLGNWVVADSVNPVRESRQGWRDVATLCHAPLLEVEVICSDAIEHRRRVESRASDIEGHRLPDWASVQSHDYVAWTEARLVLDTAILGPADALAKIDLEIARRRPSNR